MCREKEYPQENFFPFINEVIKFYKNVHAIKLTACFEQKEKFVSWFCFSLFLLINYLVTLSG